MRLDIPGGGHITFDDERAAKVRKGHAYRFEHGELIVDDVATGIDYDNLLEKLDSNTASTPEVQKLLAHLLREHLENGKI